MSANNAGRRNSRGRNIQGDTDNQDTVQDPYISSTVFIPSFTVTKPRIRTIRADCVGLFYPLPSTTYSSCTFVILLCSIA